MAHLSRLSSLLTGIVALTMAAVPAGAAPPSLEKAVKASYIFKFAPFIEWPAGAFASPVTAFTICISGQDPFGVLMDDVVRGQRIRGRPILIRRLTATAPTSGCHILFMGRLPTPAAPIMLAPPGQPVLTISEADSGTPDGMIRFVMQGTRVRFQIDDDAARANGIVVSSKLLSLSIGAPRR